MHGLNSVNHPVRSAHLDQFTKILCLSYPAVIALATERISQFVDRWLQPHVQENVPHTLKIQLIFETTKLPSIDVSSLYANISQNSHYQKF